MEQKIVKFLGNPKHLMRNSQEKTNWQDSSGGLLLLVHYTRGLGSIPAGDFTELNITYEQSHDYELCT